MTRARRTAVLALAALLLAGAAGCGSDGAKPPGPSPTPSPSASRTPTGLPSPTDRSPHGVLLSAQLAMDTARRAGYSARFGEDSFSGVLFWAPKTVLRLKRPGSSEQLVILDTTAYRGGDPATAERNAGRHWEKYAAQGGARDIPYGALVDRLNPMVALTAAVAAERPQLIGEETIAEVTVQHYRVTLSSERYAAAQTQLPTARQDALRAGLGSAEVTLDLWLDDKDQLVRLVRAGGQGKDTVTYQDWGGALSVQAPDAADTADMGGAALPPLAS
ncbi:hypothetical protein ACIRBX_10175 [Kitasatospora sp. NPDC096147]|uniref:hypothetical protein n=1 Tax=Kitasatospora sp. NPDC096147 TaxID=3364093 RepID=UPI003822F8C8